MKIGLFSDSHYCRETTLEGSRCCSLSLQKITEAMDRFCQEQVDLAICMGDLVDVGDDPGESRECLKEVLARIDAYDVPFVLVPGNHDFKVHSLSEWQAMERP